MFYLHFQMQRNKTIGYSKASNGTKCTTLLNPYHIQVGEPKKRSITFPKTIKLVT